MAKQDRKPKPARRCRTSSSGRSTRSSSMRGTGRRRRTRAALRSARARPAVRAASGLSLAESTGDRGPVSWPVQGVRGERRARRWPRRAAPSVRWSRQSRRRMPRREGWGDLTGPTASARRTRAPRRTSTPRLLDMAGGCGRSATPACAGSCCCRQIRPRRATATTRSRRYMRESEARCRGGRRAPGRAAVERLHVQHAQWVEPSAPATSCARSFAGVPIAVIDRGDIAAALAVALHGGG